MLMSPIVCACRYSAQKKFMEFTATAQFPAIKQSLSFRHRIRIGGDCKFTKIIECIGVPSLTEKNREHGVTVIGIIGRQFLQNVHLEIDGATGKLKLLITDSIDNLHG